MLDLIPFVELLQRIEVMAVGLQSLKDQEDPLGEVTRLRSGFETRLQKVSEKIQALFLSQGKDVIRWANRVDICLKNFDTIDKNLPFWGKRQWNWDEVIKALALVFTIIQEAEGILLNNSISELLEVRG